MSVTITCHDGDTMAARFGPTTWRPPAHEQIWAGCSFCGSMHPEFLAEALKAGTATLHGADWKYGWPHKFYVEVVNPEPDRDYEVGSRTEGGVTTPIVGKRPTLHGKFYNEHLLDDGVPAELFALFEEHGHIAFEVKDGQLCYRSPGRGYQKP